MKKLLPYKHYLISFLLVSSTMGSTKKDSYLITTNGLTLYRQLLVNRHDSRLNSKSNKLLPTHRKLLLKHGKFNKNSTQNTLLLCQAIKTHDTKKIEKLLKYPAALDLKVRINGNSLLHFAVLQNNEEAVGLLIDTRLLEINSENEQGSTPLHLATEQDNIKIVTLLLVNKALVNIQNSIKDRPLHIAHRQNNESIANILILYGADVIAENKDGKTPYDILDSVLQKQKQNQSIFSFIRNLWS